MQVLIPGSPQNFFDTTPFDFKNHNRPSTPTAIISNGCGTIFLLLLYSVFDNLLFYNRKFEVLCHDPLTKLPEGSIVTFRP